MKLQEAAAYLDEPACSPVQTAAVPHTTRVHVTLEAGRACHAVCRWGGAHLGWDTTWAGIEGGQIFTTNDPIFQILLFLGLAAPSIEFWMVKLWQVWLKAHWFRANCWNQWSPCNANTIHWDWNQVSGHFASSTCHKLRVWLVVLFTPQGSRSIHFDNREKDGW